MEAEERYVIPAFATVDRAAARELLDDHAQIRAALLEQHLPGFSTHPQLAMAKSMSLATVAKFSGGMITDELLQKVDAALKAL